jgi:hypothetical protein
MPDPTEGEGSKVGGPDRTSKSELQLANNICKVCFCLLADGFMDAHLYWHRMAASPMAHGMYVHPILSGNSDAEK